MLARSIFMAALLALGAAAAYAQTQPSVKELLGKAQSEADKRAVEDLISKLKSRNANPEKQAEPRTASPAPPSAQTPGTPAPASPPASASVSPPPPPPAETPVAPPKESASSTPPPADRPQQAAPADSGPAAPPASAQPARPQQTVPSPVPQRTPPPAVASPAPPPASPPTVASPAPPVAPPVVPTVTRPPAITHAPEMAEKLDLPRVDIEVYFDLDSAVISPRSVNQLVILGKALTDPRLADAKFVIGGHTDAFGPPAYNVDLSARRAEAVRQFLIERFGLPPDHLIARGYGSQVPKVRTNPFAPQNRRVQIINWTEASGEPGK